MIEFFIGFIMGYLVGNKKEVRVVSTGVSASDLQKYDNLVLKGVWQGQKEYLRIMIASVDAGLSIEELRDVFTQQLDYCDQEIAVSETKSILS